MTTEGGDKKIGFFSTVIAKPIMVSILTAIIMGFIRDNILNKSPFIADLAFALPVILLLVLFVSGLIKYVKSKKGNRNKV